MATPTAARPSPAASRVVADQDTDYRHGILFGVAAYGMWGMFPLYWRLLPPAAAVEILAHRIAWSAIVVLVTLWFVRRRHGAGLASLRAVFADRRRFALLASAAVVITFNWGTYIWAVNHDHVVETSLGYFINPLVTVVVGVLVLSERLRPVQWVAVGLGGVAVVVLTFGYGRLPWIALILAGTFACYGLVKKYVAVGAAESHAVETATMFLPAVGYLVVLQAGSSGTFVGHGIWHTLLLAGTGLISAVPLLAFGAAALRIPLSMLGLLQYLAPVMQFLLGVLVFAEAMPPEQWFGFGLVWLALTVLTWDGLAAARRRRRAAITPSATC